MTFMNSKSGNARLHTFALATVLTVSVVWTLEAQIANPIQAAKDALKAKQPSKATTPASAASNPAANNNGTISPPPGTKVEATLLSPPLPGAGFAVSPLGIHMATLTRSGSRPVVLYDNAEGPKFDQIIGGQNSQTAFAFSPDGTRYAY